MHFTCSSFLLSLILFLLLSLALRFFLLRFFAFFSHFSLLCSTFLHAAALSPSLSLFLSLSFAPRSLHAGQTLSARSRGRRRRRSQTWSRTGPLQSTIISDFFTVLLLRSCCCCSRTKNANFCSQQKKSNSSKRNTSNNNSSSFDNNNNNNKVSLVYAIFVALAH